MKPIGLISFIIGILVLGMLWLAVKPSYDTMATVALNNSMYSNTGATVVTSTESAWFSIFPFLIAGVILVWLVICLVKKGGNNAQ